MENRIKPVVLCILDGWGDTIKDNGNAINLASTPNWDRMLETYPHNLIEASGEAVGLPSGQMGNSEVGHMNIGAGRVVMQLLGQIEKSIKTDTLKDNEYLKSFISDVKNSNGDCHIIGLLSDGGVHAHIDHIISLAKDVAKNNVKVFFHAITDGRDTPPQSAEKYLRDLVDATKDFDNVVIATVGGRYYAMDRNNNWDRVQIHYDAIVEGKSVDKFQNPIDVIKHSYEMDKTDEFIIPSCKDGYVGMKDGDGLIIANFRADRVRQIASAFVTPEFGGFEREKIVKFSSLLGMAEYSEELNGYYKTLFPAPVLHNIFGEVVANNGLCQLRIAETEKYAHVTFFFNGGEEKTFDCEERVLIPSPDVATYDMKPEMSAREITDNLEKIIAEDKFDVIIVNYANGDMVGHTGTIDATVKAAQTVDECIARLEKAVLSKNGVLLITADHGNAEKMLDKDGVTPWTAHTTNKVEAILIGKNDVKSLNEGKLADLAPTLLKILGLEIPKEMDGKPLY